MTYIICLIFVWCCGFKCCNMNFILILILSVTVPVYSIRIRATYSQFAPSSVPNGIYQEIVDTIYLDAKAVKSLTEPQYITSIEEITYRKELNEKELVSFYNFRNLLSVSIVNNGQKTLPNFRSLPKFRKLQITQTNISSIDKNSISNVPLEIVDLQKNIINEIEKSAFSKKVRALDLKCNRLMSLSADWFRNASNLEWLNVESNKIQIIQENLFKKFTRLTELYLAKNEITALESGSLSGPKYMNILDLSKNDISVLNANIVTTYLHIETLKVSFNRLTFIKSDVMAKITVSSNSFIDGNPWQCPCVKKIRDWLIETKVKYVTPDEASCVFTINYSQNCEEDESLNNELYLTFISSYALVDNRKCSTNAVNYDEEKRKDDGDDIDIRQLS